MISGAVDPDQYRYPGESDRLVFAVGLLGLILFGLCGSQLVTLYHIVLEHLNGAGHRADFVLTPHAGHIDRKIMLGKPLHRHRHRLNGRRDGEDDRESGQCADDRGKAEY